VRPAVTLCCRFCFVDLANAGELDTALQLSGREFKGNALKVEVSQKKAQQPTPGKTQEKQAGKGKAGGQEHSDTGDLAFYMVKRVAKDYVLKLKSYSNKASDKPASLQSSLSTSVVQYLTQVHFENDCDI